MDPLHEHLSTVAGRHHTSRSVEHRCEVVALEHLGLTERETHPHGQFKPLGAGRRCDGRIRRTERRRDPIAGVFEQVAAEGSDRFAQHFVVGSERDAHRLGVNLPPAGRTFDVSEEERDCPRRRDHSATLLNSAAPASRGSARRRLVTRVRGSLLSAQVRRQLAPWSQAVHILGEAFEFAVEIERLEILTEVHEELRHHIR